MRGVRFALEWSAARFFVIGLLLPGVCAVGQEEAARGELLGATPVDGFLQFSSPVPVNWEALAPSDWVGFDIAHPPADLLSEFVRKEGSYFHADFHFHAPLPRDFDDYVFHLIAAEGIRQITAERLKGTVRFRLGGRSTITERVVFGYVIASPGAGEPEAPAGFVLPSTRHTKAETWESTYRAVELVPPQVRDRWRERSKEERHFWTIQHQYSFRFDTDNLTRVFVQWAPDNGCYEGCCAVRLSVFQADELLPVASYDGQCDI
jgi:hypothetical protein